jgi:alanine racemase
MAVVKANAYGHGMLRIAQESLRWGVDYLAVARYHEGIRLRESGIKAPVLVFELVPDESITEAIERDLELTVVSMAGLRLMQQCSVQLKRQVTVHVKVDTGMGRLGVNTADAARLIEAGARLRGINLKGVYSHFATSEDADQTFAREQVMRFVDVLNELERRRVQIPLRHMANSGAIISLKDACFDMVRPGIMLYGYAPRKGMPESYPVQPVMSLKSHAAFVKDVPPGISVSYGRRYFTKAETRIVTVPIGYADGYFRLLTDRAKAIINGVRYPVVGTVCMDQIMLDVGLPADIREGDTVTLLGTDGGESITAWDIGEAIGTIPYEVTCLVTDRVPRVYVEESL